MFCYFAGSYYFAYLLWKPFQKPSSETLQCYFIFDYGNAYRRPPVIQKTLQKLLLNLEKHKCWYRKYSFSVEDLRIDFISRDTVTLRHTLIVFSKKGRLWSFDNSHFFSWEGVSHKIVIDKPFHFLPADPRLSFVNFYSFSTV